MWLGGLKLRYCWFVNRELFQRLGCHMGKVGILGRRRLEGTEESAWVYHGLGFESPFPFHCTPLVWTLPAGVGNFATECLFVRLESGFCF